MFRNALASAVVFSILCAGCMLAGPIDPIGPEYPDVGTDNLYLSAPLPICFAVGSDTDCLDDVSLTASGAPETFSGANELDSFTGYLSGEVIQDNTDDLGPFSLPGTFELELQDRSSGQDGTFNSEIPEFDFSGDLPGIGPAELNIDGSPLVAPSSTTITDAGGGQFHITSFFDIFTEISIDGGNFIGSNQTSSVFDVAQSPEPGSAALALLGVIALLVFVRRARAARAS